MLSPSKYSHLSFFRDAILQLLASPCTHIIPGSGGESVIPSEFHYQKSSCCRAPWKVLPEKDHLHHCPFSRRQLSTYCDQSLIFSDSVLSGYLFPTLINTDCRPRQRVLSIFLSYLLISPKVFLLSSADPTTENISPLWLRERHIPLPPHSSTPYSIFSAIMRHTAKPKASSIPMPSENMAIHSTMKHHSAALHLTSPSLHHLCFNFFSQGVSSPSLE